MPPLLPSGVVLGDEGGAVASPHKVTVSDNVSEEGNVVSDPIDDVLW